MTTIERESTLGPWASIHAARVGRVWCIGTAFRIAAVTKAGNPSGGADAAMEQVFEFMGHLDRDEPNMIPAKLSAPVSP